MTVPTEPVREGSRWRYRRPTAAEVNAWFATQKLDDGMEHDDFVSGILVIPSVERVDVQVERNGRPATEEAHELVFTPYVRVDTRVAYFHRLAEQRDCIPVIEHVPHQQPNVGGFDNGLPEGFRIVEIGPQRLQFACCTMRVSMCRGDAAGVVLREGVASKLVPLLWPSGAADGNALEKAETGAVGRALGMAGILVVGTGVATAEDVAELRRDTIEVEMPASIQGELSPEQLTERLFSLSAEVKEQNPEGWADFSAWWQERADREGWATIADAPVEVRRAVLARLGGHALVA